MSFLTFLLKIVFLPTIDLHPQLVQSKLVSENEFSFLCDIVETGKQPIFKRNSQIQYDFGMTRLPVKWYNWTST